MFGRPSTIRNTGRHASLEVSEAVEKPGGDHAIELQCVEKIFDASSSEPVHALKGVSLRIRDGELFTLLGPSGCGKTTILRIIAGFETVSRGRVLLFGRDLGGLPPHRRPINTVFQQYALFPHLTVEENVAFGPEMLGWERSAIRDSVEYTLSLVQMSGFAGRRPTVLSGGQQQRIALARALASRPRVLLLDEPLSALDLKLRQSMRMELKDLQVRTGITFIFVTHDQEEALTMSDRLAVMREGVIEQVGAPEAIYEQPDNRFVAEFIGDTNVIPAKVEALDGPVALCSFPGGCLTVANTAGKSPGDPVTLVVRPEKLRVVSQEMEGEVDGIKGEVLDRVYMGTDTSLRIHCGGTLDLVARRQNSGFGQTFPRNGATVWVVPAFHSVRMLKD